MVRAKLGQNDTFLTPLLSHCRLPLNYNCLEGQCHKIFCFRFFHESVSPQPQSIPIRPFQIFLRKLEEIFASQVATGINDTGGKFATGVNDTGGKQWQQSLFFPFATGGKP